MGCRGLLHPSVPPADGEEVPETLTVWDKFMYRYQEDIYVSVPQYGAATVDLNTWFRVTFHHTAAGCHINTCSVFGGSLRLFSVTLTTVLTDFSSVVVSCQLVFLPHASSSLFSTDLIFRTLCPASLSLSQSFVGSVRLCEGFAPHPVTVHCLF